MQDQIILLAIVWYAVFVVTASLHEAAHAFAAWRLGDPTGYRAGSATLDPIPHMIREPIGMIVVPLISFILNRGEWMIGWASCPYDPNWALAHPKRAGLMALAGPVSNAVLAFTAAITMRMGLQTGFFDLPPVAWKSAQVVVGGGSPLAEGLAVVLSICFTLNLMLCVFNLFPLPPLDGSAVLLMFVPPSQASRLQQFLWDPTFQLLGLVAAWALAPKVIAFFLFPALSFIREGGL